MKMRKSLVCTIFLMQWQLTCGVLWAQINPDTSLAVRKAALKEMEKRMESEVKVVWDDQLGVPKIVSGELTTPGYLYRFKNATEAAFTFLSENKSLFGISIPQKGLKLTSEWEDELDMRHLRFRQYANGLRVVGCELLLHFSKNGSIESVNGGWVPSFNMSTAASISKNQAVTIASTRVGKSAELKATELIFYRMEPQILLAWEVKLSEPDRPKMEAIIDARDGTILYFDDGLRF